MSWLALRTAGNLGLAEVFGEVWEEGSFGDKNEVGQVLLPLPKVQFDPQNDGSHWEVAEPSRDGPNGRTFGHSGHSLKGIKVVLLRGLVLKEQAFLPFSLSLSSLLPL